MNSSLTPLSATNQTAKFKNICYRVANLSQTITPETNSGFFTPNNTLTVDYALQLLEYCNKKSSEEDKSNPMKVVGMSIAAGILVCTIAMFADFVRGLRNEKYWYPVACFPLNSLFLTIIPIAVKLTVDLSGEMPGEIDQIAKLGSLAFLCIVMVNTMPCLASMSNRGILGAVLALSIFVITVLVNAIIEIGTGVISNSYPDSSYRSIRIIELAYMYVAITIVLLIITISSSLSIPITKAILNLKYQTKKTTLPPTQTRMSLVELRQYVKRFAVMAETGSPQLVMASSPLSTVAGVICVVVALVQSIAMFESLPRNLYYTYESAYKNSMVYIFWTLSIAVVVGTFAPMFRCFLVLSFKFVINLMVVKVENYWTQKLYDWKQNYTPYLSTRAVLYKLKGLFLIFCIGFQMVVVILCKVIWLLSLIILKLVAHCFKLLKAILFTPPISEINEDLRGYALYIQDEMEFSQKRLESISYSLNSLFLKAEHEEHKGLLELLGKSQGFDGVKQLDKETIEALNSPVVLVNTWSLTIVTLTSIAISLPRIPKDQVVSLVKSVSEALLYIEFVEKSIDPSSEYLNTQEAAMTLWGEVKHNRIWLKNSLSRKNFEGKRAIEILNWFADRAREIFLEISQSSRGMMLQIPKEFIASNSMYRIAKSILSREEINSLNNEEQFSIQDNDIFELLNVMISDILCACFTNIPHGIIKKCHESTIEALEKTVRDVANLLGKTTKIIEGQESLTLPDLEACKMGYIDEWRLALTVTGPDLV